jgi:hypothetical protein
MANVSQQRPDPMDNFFKGIQALNQGAENLVRYQTLNKQLDMEKAIADMKFGQAKQETASQSISSMAQAWQAAALYGTGDPTTEALQKIGINPATWASMSREQRQAARDLGKIGAQHAAKVGEINLKEKWDAAEQALKEAGMNDRQIKKIKADFAAKNVSPGKAAMGAASGEEVLTPSEDIIQPMEELLSVPGIFGAKKVMARDLINKVGTKKLTPMLPYIKKANEVLASSPGSKKEIIKRLAEKFPELKDFLE